jgi:hypothetical protein
MLIGEITLPLATARRRACFADSPAELTSSRHWQAAR